MHALQLRGSVVHSTAGANAAHLRHHRHEQRRAYGSCQLLRIRHENNAWAGAEFVWLDVDPNVVAFRRGSLICAVNCSGKPVSFPSDGEVLASGSSYNGSLLEGDSAVWLRA